MVFGEEFSTFAVVVDVISPQVKLILSIFKLVSQRKYVRPITIGKGVTGIALERVRLEGQSGRLGRHCVVFSGCRSK